MSWLSPRGAPCADCPRQAGPFIRACAGSKIFRRTTRVYLHSSERRSKAEGYSVHVRRGKPHVYVAVLLETLYDPSQSLKKVKSTDQLATKETLALGEAVRDWNPDLEIDPADMLRPAYLCDVSVPVGVWEAHSKEPSYEHFRSRTIRLLEETLTPITLSEPATELGGVAPRCSLTLMDCQRRQYGRKRYLAWYRRVLGPV